MGKRFYNWINVSENACVINRSLICDFLLDIYNQSCGIGVVESQRFLVESESILILGGVGVYFHIFSGAGVDNFQTPGVGAGVYF